MACTKQFSITVAEDDNCFLNSSTLPTATVGQPYSAFLNPAFLPDPGMQFVFSVISGTLDSGLNLDSPTGEIFGTPVGDGGEFCVELTQVPI